MTQMDHLLAHPAFQAAIAPFFAALVVAAALRRTQLIGLAVVCAFAVAVGLTMGYTFETFTAVRKLEVTGLGTPILIVALALTRLHRNERVRLALDLALAASVPWLLWRVLHQQEAANAMLKGLASAAFAALLLDAALRCGSDSIRSALTGLMLGLAVAVLAFLSASLVLGQWAVAVAAGSAAALLVLLAAPATSQGAAGLALPGAVICALAALLAVFTGSLPWFCLLPLPAIPWATRLVPQDLERRWRTASLSLLACLPAVALAVGLAWFAGSSST
jgi:hypothetical protein